MKKIISYIFILFIVLFAFINKVNADFSCNPSITINEISQAAPAEVSAIMPVCNDSKFEGYLSIFTGESYPDVKKYARETEVRYYSTVDNKDVVKVLVPHCDRDLARIHAELVYDAVIFATPIYATKCDPNQLDICTNKAKNDCNSDYCEWVTPSDNGGNTNMESYNTPVVRNVSALVDTSTPYCKKVKNYCVEIPDYDKPPIDYSCPSGWSYYSETRKSACKHQYSFTTGYECIYPGMGYSKSSKSCVNGVADDETLSKDAEEIKAFFTRECNEAALFTGGDYKCEFVKFDYVLDCPEYSCIQDDQNVSICTPTFANNNNEKAYCVNPSDSFSTNGSGSAEYKEDGTFSVTDCDSSFNTVDCGYANILIEGQYYSDISSKAVEFAMRLWGIHTNQSGFDSISISSRTGSNCTSGIYYMRVDGEFPNIYANTYKEAMRNLFEEAHSKFTDDDGYLDPLKYSDFGLRCNETRLLSDSEGNTFHRINDSSKYAVACGGSKTQKQAIALLFNTILGNSKMKEHLYSKHGDASAIPTDADFVEETTEDGFVQYIYVRYEDEEFDEIFTNTQREIIDCSKLNTDPVLKEHINEIKPYCTTRVVALGPNDEVLTTPGQITECIKQSGCRRKTTLGQAVCDITTVSKQPVKIRVEYTDTYVTRSIKKLIPCSGSKSQYLYYIVDPTHENGIIKDPVTSTVTTTPSRGTKTFNVTGFVCSGTFCEDSSVQSNLNTKCKNDLNYNGVFKSSIKDPSLKCIMNLRNQTAKDMYDYSNYFHVNTDLCRIYCSDEVEYTIADKVKENSGRNFKYDIPLNGTGFNGKVDVPLTAVVKEKRTCVSKIFYDDITSNIDSIRRKYNLTEAELPTFYPDSNGNKTIPANFRRLTNALVQKAANENNRGENINQIIYDLYNCNLFSSTSDHFGSVAEGRDSANGTTIRKPDDNKTGNVRKYINEAYSIGNRYGLENINNCKITIKNGKLVNECIVHADMNYNFAPEVDAKKGVKMGSVATASSSLNRVYYCSGSGCFDYALDDDNPYSYGNGNTSGHVTSYTFNNLKNIRFSTINIPTNDYAYFTISVEVGFFNNQLFTVEPDTGKVYFKDNNDKFMQNEPYTYPTDRYSANTCSEPKNIEGSNAREIEAFTKTYNRCEVTQSFSTFATFFRNYANDEFKSTIKKAQTFTCYVDVAKPCITSGSTNPNDTKSNSNPDNCEVYYRNVDPTNLFPNGSISRNWDTAEGRAAQTQIETSGDSFRFDDTLLDYTITLTPTQIKNLKEYNQSAGDYSDESVDLGSCFISPDKKDSSGNIIEYGYYYNCKSTLLNKIRQQNGGQTSYATIEMGEHNSIK